MLVGLFQIAIAVLLQGAAVPLPAPPAPGAPPAFVIGPGNVLAPAGVPQTAQQPLPPGTAALEGIVTAFGGSDPVPGAIVEMRKSECSRTGGESMTTTSGPDGKFSFKQVRAGSWCIGAAKAGGVFSPVEYRQRGYKARGMALPVSDNQRIQDIRLAMPRTGSISGRVLDTDGEPMGHARVQAMEAFYQGGERRLYTLNVVQTNDQGEFSLSWLPPGEYYVSAVPEDPSRQNVMFSVSPPGIGGHRSDAMPPVVSKKNLPDGSFTEEVYVPVYYGGGSDPKRAQKIDVAPGSAMTVDLSFAGARVQAFHIRGRAVNGATGQPAEGSQIRLYPKEWTATAVVPYGRVAKDGTFDIGGIAPGSYTLYASGSTRDPNSQAPALTGLQGAQLQQLILQGVNLAGAIPLAARLPVEMSSRSLDNVSLTLLPGGTLGGEFVFEGSLSSTLTAQQKSSFRVNLVRQPDIPGATLGGASTGNLPPSGVDSTFRLQSIFPGEFTVMVAPLMAPFSWTAQTLPEPVSGIYVKSIRFGSADVLNGGLSLESYNPEQTLQIVLAAGGRLEGAVFTDRKEPAANVKVALIPDYAARGRDDLYRSATTDAAGVFKIQGIPPGDYRVLAWEDIADGAWQDEEIQRAAAPQAKTVRIREGEPSAVELVAVPEGRR